VAHAASGGKRNGAKHIHYLNNKQRRRKSDVAASLA
jgi:hypothetical protein